MANVKLKLLHVLDILLESDEQHTVNATQIVDRLINEFGIKTERKSVCRDISTLQSFGHDIIADRDKRKGWYYGKRAFENWQIRLFLDAVSNASFISKSDFKDIYNKLIKDLGHNDRKMFKDIMPAITNARKVDTSKLKTVLTEILHSVSWGRAIEFQIYTFNSNFKSVLRRGSVVYKVDPYNLLWKDSRYYLVGSLEGEKNLRLFRVDRIANPRTTGTPIRSLESILGENSEAKLSQFIKSSFHKEKDTVYDEVVIRFKKEDDEVLNYNKTNLFVDQFDLPNKVENKDGYVYATINNLSVTEHTRKWLISYADIFKVTYPKELQTTIKEEIALRAKTYED